MKLQTQQKLMLRELPIINLGALSIFYAIAQPKLPAPELVSLLVPLPRRSEPIDWNRH
jgi:hypothetical protein